MGSSVRRVEKNGISNGIGRAYMRLHVCGQPQQQVHEGERGGQRGQTEVVWGHSGAAQQVTEGGREAGGYSALREDRLS